MSEQTTNSNQSILSSIMEIDFTDPEVLKKNLRHALSIIVGMLIEKFKLDPTLTLALVVVIVGGGNLLWTNIVNTKKARIAEVAAMPEVKAVATTPAIAASIPAPEVIAAENVAIKKNDTFVSL